MQSALSSSPTASHPTLDKLESSLSHVLAVLEEKWDEIPLSLTSIPPPATEGVERTFRLAVANEPVAQIRFGVSPLGAGTYEVCISLADGPTRRLTYDSTREDGTDTEQSWLERTATSVLLEEIEPRLDPIESHSSSTGAVASVPRIDLDCEGTIQNVNPEARKIFDDIGILDRAPSFFGYVHGRNLRRVIRDLAHMERGEMQSARWLLRLQTAAERWRWYRARATNRLQSEDAIHVHLHPLNSPQPDANDSASP